MGWETVLGTRPALRVLVVGDRADDLVPSAADAEVSPTRVRDVPAALAALAESRFDCVLLEVAGVDPSGVGGVRDLRDRAGTAAVVVVCGGGSDGAGVLEDLADLVLGRDELAGAGVAALRQASERARLDWRLRTAEAMFTLGDDGLVTSWTAGAAELYGYTAAEVVGRDAAVLHPLSSTDVGPSLAGGREGGAVRGHDTVCRTRDGRLLPITLDAAPQVDGHGKPVGWVVVARSAIDRGPARWAD